MPSYICMSQYISFMIFYVTICCANSIRKLTSNTLPTQRACMHACSHTQSIFQLYVPRTQRLDVPKQLQRIKPQFYQYYSCVPILSKASIMHDHGLTNSICLSQYKILYFKINCERDIKAK